MMQSEMESATYIRVLLEYLTGQLTELPNYCYFNWLVCQLLGMGQVLK